MLMLWSGKGSRAHLTLLSFVLLFGGIKNIISILKVFFCLICLCASGKKRKKTSFPFPILLSQNKLCKNVDNFLGVLACGYMQIQRFQIGYVALF